MEGTRDGIIPAVTGPNKIDKGGKREDADSGTLRGTALQVTAYMYQERI